MSDDSSEEEPLVCAACRGTGETGESCPVCYGYGAALGVVCWVCRGSGQTPCRVCHGWGKVAVPPPAPAAHPRRGPVLVVEDEANVRESLGQLLEAEGFPVVLARHGLDALQQLEGGLRPCLVLLELITPHLNGWQFRELQQRNRDLASIPVVIISAVDLSISDALRLKADAYLLKPIDSALLLDLVARYCG